MQGGLNEPMEYLIVVDMQNDFITGALGTAEAEAIVPAVAERIRSFPGRVLFTRDTHEANYLETQEGRKLPVPHCIRNTDGWQLHPMMEALRTEPPIDKPTFGSMALAERLRGESVERVTLIGLCTDICVLANAMLLRAALPETPIVVDAACCAGVTPESHRRALETMKPCQIEILEAAGNA